MKLTKLLIFCFSSLMFSVIAMAQDVTVNGVINDESGLPVPGATISVKGTKKATASDFDGKFQISVPSNGTLSVTFVGYVTVDEPVNGRTKLDIKLRPESQNLNEVVVVGYGTQKKSVVTGSISSVKAKDLESLPITRVEQALQGRVSGVSIAANAGQPGSASTIRIRGFTTLNNNDPLWVVDGVIVDNGGIGYLNQSDIESIEVLKDGASGAIYGSRAAAGVILVTTKKGKAGKISVNYTGYAGTSQAAKKIDLLDASQYTTILNEAYVNGGKAAPFAPTTAKGTNWQDVIFNDHAQRYSHELSFSGGNDTSTFYMSFGLTDQEGIITTDISNYTRKNIRLNSNHKLGKYIKIGQTLGYSNEKTIGIGNTNDEFGGPLSSAINLDPLTPSIVGPEAAVAGSPYVNANALRDANGNYYGISTNVTQETSNPLAYTQTRLGNNDFSENFVGNIFVEAEILPGLKFRSTAGAKLAYYGSDNFTPVYYLNGATKKDVNELFRSYKKSYSWNWENTLNYAKKFGDHNFSVLVGKGTYVDNITSGNDITYRGVPATTHADASFNVDIPIADKIANAYNAQALEHRVESLFGRLNYDYKEKYIFTGIIRRDGSTRFGPNHKYGTFPSVSLGWVPSKEGFWKENDVVNNLKIRGGYGVTGNDSSPDFLYISTVGIQRNYTIGGNIANGQSTNAIANPDLKWEETKQTNIGFETMLFHDFNLSVDFFNKKTEGILMPVPVPGYVGATGKTYANLADMENRGIDIELGYRKKIGALNLSVNGNFSYIKNEITYLDKGTNFLVGDETVQSSSYEINRTQVGQAYNSFYGFKTNGIFQTQADVDNYKNAAGKVIQPNAKPGDFRWQDLDGDGSIGSNDRTFLGTSLPKYTYGFTLNLDYKGFDMLVFGQGAGGNMIYQGLRRLDITNANYQTEVLGRWTGPGSTNSYPRVTTNDTNKNFTNPSDFNLEKGDFFRFKTVQLGYSFPKEWIESISLQKVRLYVTGENLWTITKYTGYDPEIGGPTTAGMNNVQGVDRGYYPQAKSYMLGVNLQF
ncbi:SusC/RagA family TonB-linked outer membrane protein [Flavobacterium pectinovorum]|uniref:SusC/RagA family TonB-linked outer membrane protein n=1 Tax=Flavobacterium pectinovorum TaxID=29533 RepID=A0AB36P2G3_9FLAO|nr:TonB-dependent receptor [Flavobacterium pectinovorum]OXB05939.1 SusC/RagA family TonB-linked outer membrane protein [Flavobacterium pectinovorum]SHM17545.1 TonB-linked outer membrane protein, SusC/RagA family [Flavobacterium pectinovorum]